MDSQSPNDRFEEANDILGSALDLPREGRRSYIQGRCPNDAALQQSILRLLNRFDQLDNFLEAPACASPERLPTGSVLAGRFRIVRKLGAGGMGEVFQAEDQMLKETVALKLIHSASGGDPEVEDRFRSEIRLARKIAHPNICRTFEVFSDTHEGRPFLFFTMQYLEGETLAACIAAHGPFSPAEALGLAAQIAAGLDAAHREGIVHRDLKPANIMLVPCPPAAPEGARRAVITDFGLAFPLESETAGSMTQSGQILGSPKYMAPEQFLDAAVTAAADIYSFALIIVEMTAGRRPFPDESIVRAAIRRTTQDVPPLSVIYPGIPPAWVRPLSQSLSRDPAARPATAGRLVHDLARPAPRLRPPSRRTLIYTASAAAAVSASAVILRLHPWRPARLPAAPTLMFANAAPPGLEAETAGAFIGLLTQQLDRSRLAVISRDGVQQAWQRMHSDGKAFPPLLDPRVAREIALRAGANMVAFTGATRKLDEWSFWVRMELLGDTPVAPATFWEHEFKTSLEGDRFSASAQAARWLAETAGASAAAVRGTVRTPQELTTSNWEALVEYTQANDAWTRGDRDAAVRHLKTALDLDPEFALAAGRMGDTLTTLGRNDDGIQYYIRASELVRRKNLTDRESLRVRGLFALDTAQWAVAEEAFSRWILEYPDDPVPLIHKATVLERMGRVEESLFLLNQAVALRPADRSAIANRALSLLRAGRFGNAARDLDLLDKIGPPNSTYQLRGALAVARLDLRGGWQALEQMRQNGETRAQSAAYSLQACQRAEQGRYQEAHALLEQGIQFDRERGLAAVEFRKRRLVAQLYLLEDNVVEVRAQCRQILAADPGFAASMEIGCLLARSGDIAGARATIPRDLPSLPLYLHWSSRVQAEIELSLNNARNATAVLLAAPDNPVSGIWPEYLVRAAQRAGQQTVVTTWIGELLANPARYWYNADATAPGFFKWAVETFAGELDSELQLKATALKQALTNSN